MTWRRWIGVALLLGIGLGGIAPLGADTLTVGGPAPDIAGGPWINSAALSLTGLRGRVVLVEFWTYG